MAQKAQYTVDGGYRGAFTWLIENDLPADNANSLLSAVSDILVNSAIEEEPATQNNCDMIA